MASRIKVLLWTIVVVAVLLAATLGIAVQFTRAGMSSLLASFAGATCAATCAALLLGIYAACYHFWARTFWGAPFVVGDRVRVVMGIGAGTDATVVSIGQGVEVEIEFASQGQVHRRRLCWGGLRRVVPGTA
jgi:hypothetical protein